MKKILLILLGTFLIFTACRSNEDWNNSSENAPFDFKVQRDQNFQPKPVNSTFTINYEILPNYNFSSIKTFIKFSQNLPGQIKLNGTIVIANQNYQLLSTGNVIQYTGTVEGTHTLKIEVTNEKNIAKEDEISLVFGATQIEFVGGATGILKFKGEFGGQANYNTKYFFKGFNSYYRVKTANSNIQKIVFTVKFTIRKAPPNNPDEKTFERVYTKTFPNPTSDYTSSNDWMDANNEFLKLYSGHFPAQIIDSELNIKAFNTDGASAEYTTSPSQIIEQ